MTNSKIIIRIKIKPKEFKKYKSICKISNPEIQYRQHFLSNISWVANTIEKKNASHGEDGEMVFYKPCDIYLYCAL